MIAYFLEVRNNFIAEGPKVVKREFMGGYHVFTEVFFVNTNGSSRFQIRDTSASFLKKAERAVNRGAEKRREDELKRIIRLMTLSKHQCQENLVSEGWFHHFSVSISIS